MSSEPAEPELLPRTAMLSGPAGDRPGNHILAYALLATILGFLIARHQVVADILRSDLSDLLVWTFMIVLVNLFPVWLRESTFTMDMPILLAVALLYPPAIAVLVALVASLDVRELLGRVSLTRAVFNRSQIASLVLVAGWIFHELARDLESWPAYVSATLIATAASFLLNVFWVTLYSGLRSGRPIWVAIRALREENLGEFAATYVGYGGLALVLAYLYRGVGVWSAFVFLVPTIVAQLMLARGRSLRALADDLRGRERLFERLSDRIIDERRDERLRIAADLHDDVLQSLIRTSQLSGFLVKEVRPSSQAFEDADELFHLTRRTIEELRRVVGELQQSPLGTGGLVPTIHGLARELQLIWRTNMVIDAVGHPRLAPSQQVVMYQMIKEAILNALKHADAGEVRVRLKHEHGRVTATVRDDGCGFFPEEVDIQSQFGIGLMRERARMSRSRVEIESVPGEGTSVTISMPEFIGK